MPDLKHLRDEWPAISARLDEALALEADARLGWLDALPEAESIKSKLRALLGNAAAVETNDFLSTLPKLTLLPGAAAGTDPARTAHEGASVGPYRLVARIGHGGMGEVWLAERIDGQPKRKVALKLPHLGWAPGLAARLGRERDILASLEHPNIARLYDAGVDRFERPYLAMEYVDGVPIDRHCAAQALPLAQRLGLLLQVCAAVAHAHAHLVVHRDLKPANILVTPAGEARLLDFGIARLLDGDPAAGSDLTRESGRPLTPDYASPEQIRGEAIGTASDIYSLGVVAYEVIAGARPYRLAAEGAAQLVAAVDSLVVPAASRSVADPALRRAIAGDLDAILARALKRDAAERYPTVDAFAADLGRHLRHEPVSAQPDRFAYRARKFIGRHRWQTASATLAVAALVAGAGVALWQAREARAEAARAEQVKAFALSMLESADTDAGAGAATTVADLLKSAQSRIDGEFAGRPEIAVELKTAIGYSLIGQGQLAESEALMRKTVAQARDELGPNHPLALVADVVHGEALIGLQRAAEAVTVVAPAVAEARRQGAARALVFGLSTLAAAQIDTGDGDAAVTSARESVAVADKATQGVRPLDRFTASSTLAYTLWATQQPGGVEAAQRALALARDIHGSKTTEPVLFARLVAAQGLVRERHDLAALAELGAVLDDAVRFLGPAHPRVQVMANFIGRTRLDAGDAAGAADAFRIQLAAAEKSRKSPLALQMGHYAIAAAESSSRRWPKALEEVDASIAFAGEAGTDPALALRARSNRALVLARLGRFDDAEKAFSALSGASWPAFDAAAHASRWAIARSLEGRRDDAVAMARTGYEGSRTNPAAGVRAIAARAFGIALLDAGQKEQALEVLREAERLYAEQQLVVSPDRAETLAALERAGSATRTAATLR